MIVLALNHPIHLRRNLCLHRSKYSNSTRCCQKTHPNVLHRLSIRVPTPAPILATLSNRGDSPMLPPFPCPPPDPNAPPITYLTRTHQAQAYAALRHPYSAACPLPSDQPIILHPPPLVP